MSIIPQAEIDSIKYRLGIAQLMGPLKDAAGDSEGASLTQFYAHDVAKLLAALEAPAPAPLLVQETTADPLNIKILARDLCYALRDVGPLDSGAGDAKARTLILEAFAKIGAVSSTGGGVPQELDANKVADWLLDHGRILFDDVHDGEDAKKVAAFAFAESLLENCAATPSQGLLPLVEAAPPQWVSVKDRLPEPFLKVFLVYDKQAGEWLEGQIETGALIPHEGGGHHWSAYESIDASCVSLWMPIPDLPAAPATDGE